MSQAFFPAKLNQFKPDRFNFVEQYRQLLHESRERLAKFPQVVFALKLKGWVDGEWQGNMATKASKVSKDTL